MNTKEERKELDVSYSGAGLHFSSFYYILFFFLFCFSFFCCSWELEAWIPVTLKYSGQVTWSDFCSRTTWGGTYGFMCLSWVYSKKPSLICYSVRLPLNSNYNSRATGTLSSRTGGWTYN